jgi:hypothetical protein
MCGAHSRSELAAAAVAVEQVGLCFGVQQRVVLVLPVHRDQVAPELAELRRACGAAVDPCGAALAKLPLEDQRRAARFEHALHRGPLGAVPHLVSTASCAEREAERVDDERLAAAGLAGEQVEAGTETHR